MAAAARTARLAPRLAAASRPSVRAWVSSVAQRASFSVSTTRSKSVIKETEVPVSVYSPDAKGVASGNSDHFSIPVKAAAASAQAVPAEEDEPVVPLQDKVFQQMPRTLQKMSVMGKVIIITG